MAVDTRNKRASAINLMLPWRGQLPAPDGSIDISDRAQLVYLYAGIDAEEIEVPAGRVTVTFSARRPRATFTAKTPAATFTARRPHATFTVED
jgi:hypothetical protein